MSAFQRCQELVAREGIFRSPERIPLLRAKTLNAAMKFGLNQVPARAAAAARYASRLSR
jgi:hypothetical protein